MLKQTRRLITGLGTTVNLGGTEQFASMRDLYIKNGQGFVVVYSLTNHQTFQDIKTMKELITRVKGTERVPILLVANKVDLEHQRELYQENEIKWRLISVIGFVETILLGHPRCDGLFCGVTPRHRWWKPTFLRLTEPVLGWELTKYSTWGVVVSRYPHSGSGLIWKDKTVESCKKMDAALKTMSDTLFTRFPSTLMTM
ncbi:hypothetical protein RUM44_004965 [Polyplax serrata]|uniref:Uncharacterized protein n=1 Tax=Polyplax serrata TaxID=468196 RepID=A0ABR1AWJ1_POLSC